MKRFRFQIALLLCGLVIPVHAETLKTTAELQAIESQMATQKAQAEQLAGKEQLARQSLQSLQQQLIAATANLQDKQEEQDDLEVKLADLEKIAAVRNADLSATRIRFSQLTTALLRLSREPPVAVLIQPSHGGDAMHRALLLHSLLPVLQQQTEKLAHELEEIETLHETAVAQKRLVVAAQQNLEWQRDNLDQLIKMRQGLLKKTAEQKQAMDQRLASLAAEAHDLRQLLEKVSPRKGLKTAPSLALRSDLKIPVPGRILHGYGEKDSYGVASQGVTLSGAPNSPVVAPQDGTVVFAGPFHGYGKIVILQHGHGYHSFLAGFERVDSEVGQTVIAGEPLGVLPAKANERPELYFEWRHDGEPADPMANNITRHTGR